MNFKERTVLAAERTIEHLVILLKILMFFNLC